jgi:poly(ADP-ribose) glycohydrolase ARH3
MSLEQFFGCLLGQAVGDALGAPYEGLRGDHIYFMHGSPDKFLSNPSGEILYYTDDTQMMIGVAETLVEHGRIVETTLCRRFAENYHPDRCYGQGARLVIEAIADGGDWRAIAENHFPGGSLGNGAAMRAAPLGLLFSDDLDRVMDEARLSALPTHVHPLGIEGAQVFALAVALALKSPFDRRSYFRELLNRAKTDEFRWHLSVASQLRRGDTLSVLGNSLEAHRSVVTAIACFTQSPRSYGSAVIDAISQGGDTDTLAGMAGALSGAHLGGGAIPVHLLEKLEDNKKGRSYIQELAQQLFTRSQSQPDMEPRLQS